MPSYDHASLVSLFRNRKDWAATLLRELDVELPEYDEVRTDESDLTNLQAAEYRADLVLLLRRGTENVLGVIVEIQLHRDEDKPYAWPAYVANLRARHRCPVCLLVVTVEKAVESWAAKNIDLGPGSRCLPWVLGPSTVPVVTDLQKAESNVELAVLSLIEHGRSSGVDLAARIASAAIVASAGLDAERFKLYFDIVSCHLPAGVRWETSTAMNSFGYEYRSEFARHCIAEGRAEGQRKVVLKLLASRFGPLSEATKTRIRCGFRGSTQ